MIADVSKLAIYEVYLRNHTPFGRFVELIEDLDRIQAMGIDVIWLMPIHPIGIEGRKGGLGSPYAVQDYRAVNPECGTLDDFLRLINEIHVRGMKCIMDAVLHHTSRDSVLLQSHPEFFHKNDKGEITNRIAGWSDVCDLNYANKELWDVQINNLKFWVQMGVDGFRCDVASLVPIEFWERAAGELKTINRDLIWLAETLTPQFLEEARRMGIEAQDDDTMYRAFDITYDYDVFPVYESYVEGRTTLDDFVDALVRQNDMYGEQRAKLRFVENHDCMRVRKRFIDPLDLKMWTAFILFLKGPVLIYAGQETCDTHTPSLFDKDPVSWDQQDDEMAAYLRRMVAIKRIYMPARCDSEITGSGGTVIIRHRGIESELIGVFNIEKKSGRVDLGIDDRIYTDLCSDEIVEVTEGAMRIEDSPIIIFVQSA
jgi:glycosidase